MANAEHLDVLNQGAAILNRWRQENPDTFLNLCGADLHGANLREVNLNRANLLCANLRKADFNKANLSQADLHGANLHEANLYEADLHGANLHEANLYKANLSKANLTKANLSKANLNRAYLLGANLSKANLNRSDLRETDLSGTNLSRSDLREADLREADLLRANLSKANLNRANLNRTEFLETVLSNIDLSKVQGLDTCKHNGPSVIDYRTLARSGQLPLSFLRGVGLPDTLIDYIPSLFNQPLQFYSCFISYSSQDEKFADRLHADLQDKGVRCWYAPEDLPIGAKIRVGIDEAIRKYDKLLLILSNHSVNSQWVEQEVETALEKERELKQKTGRDQTVLFPVRLDDAVMESKDGWTRLIKNSRNIGNFANWKEYDSYQKGIERLVKDLKASLYPKE